MGGVGGLDWELRTHVTSAAVPRKIVGLGACRRIAFGAAFAWTPATSHVGWLVKGGLGGVKVGRDGKPEAFAALKPKSLTVKTVPYIV